MKTLTEFFGPTLRKAQEEIAGLAPAAQPRKKGKKADGAPVAIQPRETAAPEVASAETADEAAPAAVETEQVAAAPAEGESTAEASVEGATSTEAAPAETTSAESAPAEAAPAAEPSVDDKINAKLTESFKLEGDKLAWFRKALELVGSKKGNVKRVLVGQLNEGEKAPAGYTEIDGKVYSVELFPEAGRPQGRQEESREGRGGRGERGKGKGGKGRGDRGGRGGPRGDDRGGRGPSSDRGASGERGPRIIITDSAGGRSEGRPEGRSRGPRRGEGQPGAEGAATGEPRPRRERTPREPVELYTGPNRIIPKGATAPITSKVVTAESHAEMAAISAAAAAREAAAKQEAKAASTEASSTGAPADSSAAGSESSAQT